MDTIPVAQALADWLASAAIQAVLLAAVVWLLITCFRRWLTPAARCALWSLVLLRLALPILPESRWSVWTLLTMDTSAPQQVRHELAAGPAETVKDGWTIHRGALSLPDAPASELAALPLAIPQPRFSIREILLSAWLIGAVAFLAAMIQSNLRLSRRLRRARVINDPSLRSLLDDCRRAMNVRRKVSLLEFETHAPALAGLFCPNILLPPGLAARLAPEQLRFILLHELAHLKRHDLLIDCLFAIIHALHWFNPAAWLAVARFRAERELARDAMVLRVTAPNHYSDYGQTLLRIVEEISAPRFPLGAVGLIEEKGHLRRRLSTIAHFRPKTPASALLGLLLVAALASTAFTQTPAADPKPDNTPAKSPLRIINVTPWPGTTTPDRADAAVAATTLPSTRPAGPLFVYTEPLDPPATAELRRRLDNRLPQVRFDAVAIADVIDFFRDVTGTNIFVNWRALESAGIDRTSPVTARLRDVKLSKALDLILKDFQDVLPKGKKLGYAIEAGVLTISTQDELNQNVQILVHDVRPLLLKRPDSDPNDPAQRSDERAGDILNVIQESVDRASWTANGGKIGSLRFLNGQLVVTQTPENQRAVVGLLNVLHQSRGLQILVETRFIQVKRGTVLNIDKFAALLGDHNEKARETGIILEARQVEALLRILQAEVKSTVLSAPRLLVYSGQPATIRIGEDLPFISAFGRPKLDGTREITKETIQTGIALEIQPGASTDRKWITVNLRPKVTELVRMIDVPWPDAGPDEKLIFQVPHLQIQERNVTAVIPVGESYVTVLQHTTPHIVDPDAATLLLVTPAYVTPAAAPAQ